MNILAIETAGTSGSVAALRDAELVHAMPLAASQRSAQSLAPAIKSLLAACGWSPTQIDLVAVVLGPGSFTGLRIGVMTAKAFAYATGAQVLGVSTLEVIAAQLPESASCAHIALDAQRGQVFAQSFRIESGAATEALSPVEIKERSTWLAELKPEQIVAGPILDTLLPELPAYITLAERELWYPTAAGAGRLAVRQWLAGSRGDLWTLAPQYHRRSAAEEKFMLSCRGTLPRK